MCTIDACQFNNQGSCQYSMSSFFHVYMQIAASFGNAAGMLLAMHEPRLHRDIRLRSRLADTNLTELSKQMHHTAPGVLANPSLRWLSWRMSTYHG